MIHLKQLINRYNKEIPTIIGIALLIGFGLIIIKRQLDEKEIKDYKEITFATVFNIRLTPSGKIFDCYYYVNGEKFEGSFKLYIGLKKAELLLNKKFPVVYSKKNPYKNYILIYSDNYKKFDVDYPDSLNWVRKLIEK